MTHPADPALIVVSGGLPYVAAISLGNAGIPLPSPDVRSLPLSAEPLFFLSLTGALPIQQNFVGALPPSGQAVAKLAIPSAPPLVNIAIDMAFVTIDGGSPSGLRTVSQPFRFAILP